MTQGYPSSTPKLAIPPATAPASHRRTVLAEPRSDSRVNYFIDWEFNEDGLTIVRISLAIVCEDGRELYIEFEFDRSKVNEWVRVNVLPHLGGACYWETKTGINHLGRQMSRSEAQAAVLEFIGDDQPRFWGWYSDYDWVTLCQLYGAMVDRPEGWPMRCDDLKQLAESLGEPELPPQIGVQHHALPDARWNRTAHHWLAADQHWPAGNQARRLP